MVPIEENEIERKIEYSDWLDMTGGPGYILYFRYDTPGLEDVNGKSPYDVAGYGNKAWAKRVAKHYGIEMPEGER